MHNFDDLVHAAAAAFAATDDPDALEPVSYTHLDVYKRQVLDVPVQACRQTS